MVKVNKKLLADLATKAAELAHNLRKRVRNRKLVGACWATVTAAVDSATPESTYPVLDTIITQCEEYRDWWQANPGRYANGDLMPHHERVPGFVAWCCLIGDGVAPLPEQLPHEFFTGWRDGFTKENERFYAQQQRERGTGQREYLREIMRTPTPCWRCMNRFCAMILPSSWEGAPCICGETRLACSSLFSPWKVYRYNDRYIEINVDGSIKPSG